MSGLEIKRAKRSGTKARIGIVAPSGAGKTFTALRLARGLVGPQGRILVLDTEHGSASKYADDPDIAGAFDVVEPVEYSPQVYIDVLELAAREKYDAVILDSLTHAWSGKGGALEMVDAAAARSKGNSYAAWRNVTPVHNRMIDAIISAPLHVIATMRSKTEYIVDTDKNGRSVPRKVGMAPIQRDGMEYEFDIVGDMDHDHNFVVTKTRCKALDERLFNKPDGEVSAIIKAWLDGAEPARPQTVTKPQPAAHEPKPVEPPEPDNAEPAGETVADSKAQMRRLCERMGAPLGCVVDYIHHHTGKRKLDDLDEETRMAILTDWAAKAELVREHEGVVDILQEALATFGGDYKNIHCATAVTWRKWLGQLEEATTNG